MSDKNPQGMANRQIGEIALRLMRFSHEKGRVEIGDGAHHQFPINHVINAILDYTSALGEAEDGLRRAAQKCDSGLESISAEEIIAAAHEFAQRFVHDEEDEQKTTSSDQK